MNFLQLVRGSWAPLAFFAKKLSSTKSHFSAFDRELLAAYSTVKHFRFLIEGKSFTIFNTQKPLTYALFRVSPPWSAKQQRHLSCLFKFTSDLIHLPGSQNVVADALSHSSLDPPLAFSLLSPVSAVLSLPSALPVDVTELSSLHHSCPEFLIFSSILLSM